LAPGGVVGGRGPMVNVNPYTRIGVLGLNMPIDVLRLGGALSQI